jgi:lipopolysaccharide export LptBFGC system permease protein LptF
MDPRKFRILLFGIGIILGGLLAFVLWSSFSHLGGWAIAGILLAAWMTAGAVSLYLIRRQNRRRF